MTADDLTEGVAVARAVPLEEVLVSDRRTVVGTVTVRTGPVDRGASLRSGLRFGW
jgi:hypothetical protein